jgi:hypothetical protein
MYTGQEYVWRGRTDTGVAGKANLNSGFRNRVKAHNYWEAGKKFMHKTDEDCHNLRQKPDTTGFNGSRRVIKKLAASEGSRSAIFSRHKKHVQKTKPLSSFLFRISVRIWEVQNSNPGPEITRFFVAFLDPSFLWCNQSESESEPLFD